MRSLKHTSRRWFFYAVYLVLEVIAALGEVVRIILLVPYYFFSRIVALIYRVEHAIKWRPARKKKPVRRESHRAKFAPFRIHRQLLRRIGAVIAFIPRALWYLVRSPFIFLGWLIPPSIRIFVAGFLLCLIIVTAIQFRTIVDGLPDPHDIGKVNYPLTTQLFDRNGKLLYEVYGDQDRTPVKLKALPPYVARAVISIEDKDFYKHKGVSISSGILRAIRDMIINHGLQGGSTLTQQLVKSALLTPERTLQRKVKEIVLALWTEQIYSKDQILEMYLNQVPYGGSAYGIEKAAETYFGKRASDLTLSEAALLAGLPQAPSVYSPFVNPKLAVKRRNDVLDRMYQYGYISLKDRDDAELAKMNVILPNNVIKAPHFVFYAKSELEQTYGIRQVEEGGLRVYTTLDLDVEQNAEKILREELVKIKDLNVSNGAVLVMRPSTGEILAMVGSADYFGSADGAYNVVTALRQPGSSVKPLMYALALEKGYTAATMIDDSPISYTSDTGEVYRPVNYDGKFHGKIPLRIALANSFNIPAVKVLNAVGVNQFVDHASQMGITTWTDKSRYGLSLTLGGVEVKMIDMATAFGVFANSGKKVLPTYLSHIEDYHNTSYDLDKPRTTRVLDGGITYIMSDILSDNFARTWEFGRNSALEIPGYKVAVKTGTTDDKKDNWTIGYTPQYLVAVWVGNNDNTPMNPYLASGITGAAPIWNRVMSYMIKEYDHSYKWYDKPADVVQKNCYYGRPEYFINGTEAGVPCSYGGSPTPSATKP